MMFARTIAATPRVRALALLRQHPQGLLTVCQTRGAVKPPFGSRPEPLVAGSALQVTCFTTASSDTPLHFDTHNVVKSLQGRGFSGDQSEAILQVMKDAMADSLEAQARILATKSEHVELKAELSERVFNSTLKFDIAQRHSRELLERDFNTLKQDIRMLEKIDFDKIRMEIAELEKKFLLQKQAEDETLNELRLSMEKVEKRMLQYAVGFAGTIMAVGAALMRLVL
ncbi:hypothetical protein V7S43_002660 [Phytophthora oleae]|uniref:DUF1640 domain-containing protein n=1 Tax=Phytophthora oleae TaxID=2107226 RepID=A0ABD3G249_9STRA